MTPYAVNRMLTQWKNIFYFGTYLILTVFDEAQNHKHRLMFVLIKKFPIKKFKKNPTN